MTAATPVRSNDETGALPVFLPASLPGGARGQRYPRGNQKDKADRETGWNNAGGNGGNILPGIQFR